MHKECTMYKNCTMHTHPPASGYEGGVEARVLNDAAPHIKPASNANGIRGVNVRARVVSVGTLPYVSMCPCESLRCHGHSPV